MPFDKELLKTAKEKIAKPLGPYKADQAATVAGLDPMIATAERNRKEYPLNYWLNPFVRGPISELLMRGQRRVAANAGGSLGGAALTELSRGALVHPVTAPLGGVGAIASMIGGNAAKKTKLRDTLPSAIDKYDETEVDREKADKKQDKAKEAAVSFGIRAANAVKSRSI